jgi:hypothetical protein
MSQDNFIFDTVDYQNSANTVNSFVKIYNAQNNATTTGNSFKFKSDADRMKNLLGSKGQSRNSGYFDGLFVNLYAITVTDPVLPSSSGPGNTGWGSKLWSGPANIIAITDGYLQTRATRQDYVGVVISGYLYSPVATTVILRTTSDDGVIVNFNQVNVIDNWTYHGPTVDTSASLTVFAGYNPILIYFFEGAGGSLLNFEYSLGGAGFTQFLNCNFFYNYNQL